MYRRQVDVGSPTFEQVKKMLMENFNAKIASRGREVVKRCHLCGDSRDLRDAHMYIGEKDGLIVYHCFKCDAGGLVDGKFFRDIGVYDPDLIIACNEQNKSASSRTVSIRQSPAVKNPLLICSNRNETIQKWNYFNNRLGCNIPVEELCRRKIVLNLHDYLQANQIKTITRSNRDIDQLDKYFIGFMSTDNCFIHMRRIVDNINLFTDERYVVYNIFDRPDNRGRFYILPTTVNPLKKISLYIAEGPFDINGIYHRECIFGGNQIFGAVTGKSYFALIKYILTELGLFNLDIHLYPDGDVQDKSIRYIKRLLIPYEFPITVHRNVYPGEKDFGVPANRIKEYSYRL